jgi:hypothetical protein
MTLPHAFNIAGSDLLHLRQSANFWAERAAAANSISDTNHSSSNSKEEKKDKEKDKEKSRIGRRRASKPFKRSKTLMESS